MKTTTTVMKDGVPVPLLKLHLYPFTSPIYSVLALIVLTLRFPTHWKVSDIILLNKESPGEYSENFCRISFSPKLSFYFEPFHFTYIYSSSTDKLIPEKFGYHTKREVVLRLFDHLETF